jgi:hypothetical protein
MNWVKPHVQRSSWIIQFGRGEAMVRVTKRQYRRDMGKLRG